MIGVSVGSTSLQYVQSVTPSLEVSPTAFVTSGGSGAAKQSVDIQGYLLGTPESLMTDSQALQDALVAEGDCTIAITGLTAFTGRVGSVTWDTYNTGPMWRYTISVMPGTNVNPYLGSVVVGAVALNNPSPAITESWTAPNVDDPMDSAHQRGFEIAGTYRGTPAQIETFATSLETAVTSGADAEGYLTLTTPMGTFSAKCTKQSIVRPSGTDSIAALTYSLSFATRVDYTLEAHDLGHTPISVGGITWDVVSSFSHSLQTQQIGLTPARKVTGESMSWSVKKYFLSVAAAEAFLPTLDALINGGATMISPNGIMLHITSASYNTVSRDGNDGTDARRYSVSCSLSYSKPTGSRVNPGGIHFGVIFDQISSVSESVSLGETGGVKSRNKTVSGKVSTYPEGILGTSSVETDSKTYYLTSENGGAIDEDGLYTLSLSGKTLESEEQAVDIVDGLFSSLFFNEITTQGRSVSHSEIEDSGVLEPTSLSENISGYIWGGNRDAILALVEVVNSSLGQAIISSVNIGKRESYRRPDTATDTYRETVSLSRSTTYNATDPAEDPDAAADEDEAAQNRAAQPDVKEEVTVSIQDRAPQYRSVAIPGRGVVMKLVGISPMKATSRVTLTAKNWTKWRAMGAPNPPTSPIGSATLVGNKSGENGFSKWVEKSWIASS